MRATVQVTLEVSVDRLVDWIDKLSLSEQKALFSELARRFAFYNTDTMASKVGVALKEISSSRRLRV